MQMKMQDENAVEEHDDNWKETKQKKKKEAAEEAEEEEDDDDEDGETDITRARRSACLRPTHRQALP